MVSLSAHMADKYGAYRPCDRRTFVTKWAVNLSMFPVGLLADNPRTTLVSWEMPQEALETMTFDQIDTMMEAIRAGLNLVFSGAERLMWDEERNTMYDQGVKWLGHYADRQKAATEEE